MIVIIKKGTFLELLPRGCRELWQAPEDTKFLLCGYGVLEFTTKDAPAGRAVSALLTKREAAQQAGVSYDTIRLWMRRGLKSILVGNQVFIDSLTLMEGSG